MDKKCPLCGGDMVGDEDNESWGCCDCFFACNFEDVEFVSAAIALARAEADLEFCRRPEDTHQFQHFVEWAREEVIKIVRKQQCTEK